MADINTSKLIIGDDGLVLQDAALRASMSAEYSASSTYAVGDIVLKDGQLYECTTAISTAEAWTAGHWTAVTVGEELTDLKAESTALKEDISQVIDSAYVTDTATGAIASFPDGADGVSVKSLKVNIEPVQSGSGDPSPDNVRPISGHTQAVVKRTGKNVWDEQWEVGEINTNSGANSNDSTRIRSKNYISIVPNQQYYCKSSNDVYLFFYDANKTYIGYYSSTAKGLSFIPSNLANAKSGGGSFANARYMRFRGDTGGSYNNDISINYPSTDHDYHAGHVQTVTIDLDGTRYGGTLNVETGVLTVDRAAYTFTNGTGLTEGTDGNADWLCVKHQISSELWDVDKRTQNICSHAPFTFANVNGHPHFYTTRNIFQLFVPKSVYESLSAFTSSLATNPLTFVAMLSTPTTVQLTANEISTLLGQNNIWNDCGDTEAEYRADTKLYIEKLTAPTEDDMVADANIVSGQYFMVGNTLYKATANIASGGAITPNVNCTRKSLPEALNEINA